MHRHLRRLERVWIDFPIYYITTCTKNRTKILDRDDVAKSLVDEWRAAHDRHGWVVGLYVIMPDHVHFFCRPELNAKRLSDFVGFWKSLESRVQRPRLQQFGNANFLITFCVQAKAIPKSGITFETIPFARVWSNQQMIGRMLARSKR